MAIELLMVPLIGIFVAPVITWAEALPPVQADAICHVKALRAAHFVMEFDKKFLISYKTGRVAEISTPIVYKYRYRGIDDPIVTVEAYAYPDNGSCVIGSITNHIAGND